MTYGAATATVVLLKNLLADNQNTVIKQSSDVASKEFMACIRRFSFSDQALKSIVDFATSKKLHLVIRESNQETCPEERYEPVAGRFPARNLVAIIY